MITRMDYRERTDRWGDGRFATVELMPTRQWMVSLYAVVGSWMSSRVVDRREAQQIARRWVDTGEA